LINSRRAPLVVLLGFIAGCSPNPSPSAIAAKYQHKLIRRPGSSPEDSKIYVVLDGRKHGSCTASGFRHMTMALCCLYIPAIWMRFPRVFRSRRRNDRRSQGGGGQVGEEGNEVMSTLYVPKLDRECFRALYGDRNGLAFGASVGGGAAASYKRQSITFNARGH
jgi:hypothetical protein